MTSARTAIAFIICLLVAGAMARASATPGAGIVRTQGSKPTAKQYLFEKSSIPLPDNVYCKMNGLEITRTEYGQWLQQFRGDSFIQEYILARLVRETAKQYNIEATPTELANRADRRIEERILNGYRGRKELFIERELANFGKTIEGLKREIMWEEETELLLQRILKTRRFTTDADVDKEYRRLYGQSGRELTLRAILLEIDPPSQTSHRSHEEIQAIIQKSTDDALRRGTEVVKRIQSGALDFASGALAYSNDNNSRRRGGDIGVYINQPPMFGPEFDAVIHKAKPGQLVGPVRIQAGFVVAEITKEVLHDLRAEREKIRKELVERDATPEEIVGYKGQLLYDAKLVR